MDGGVGLCNNTNIKNIKTQYLNHHHSIERHKQLTMCKSLLKKKYVQVFDNTELTLRTSYNSYSVPEERSEMTLPSKL